MFKIKAAESLARELGKPDEGVSTKRVALF